MHHTYPLGYAGTNDMQFQGPPPELDLAAVLAGQGPSSVLTEKTSIVKYPGSKLPGYKNDGRG